MKTDKKLSYFYTPELDNPLLKGIDLEPRPWQFIERVKVYAESHISLLDVGCGTAEKILQLAPFFAKIVGLEPNPLMREKALEKALGIENFQLTAGYAHSLPFPNESFDIVTSMLAPIDAEETYRVLKPGGMAILEKIGDQDKESLKALFGEQRCYFQKPENGFKGLYEENFQALFSSFMLEEGYWKTAYSIEGLILLLEQAPIIRNFKKENDMDVIKAELMRDQQCIVEQHRYFIIAKK